MSPDLRDDLDRTIDEALVSAVAGEPRRVDAASVRRALDQQTETHSAMPAWFGLAAVLLVGVGLALTLTLPDRPGSSKTSPVPGPIEARGPVVPVSTPEATSAVRVGVAGAGLEGTAPPAPPRRRGLAPALATAADLRREGGAEPREESEPGVPRLRIAALAWPDPLSTQELVPRGIGIAAIEIAPLSFSSLSSAQEP